MLNSETNKALDAILDEMEYQNHQSDQGIRWQKNNRDKSLAEWLLIIEQKVNESRKKWVISKGDIDSLVEVIQIGALCVQALSRNPHLKEALEQRRATRGHEGIQ